MNHCDECGLDFYYSSALHVCKSKGVALPGSEHEGESFVDECMRKQNTPSARRSELPPKWLDELDPGTRAGVFYLGCDGWDASGIKD